MLACGDDTDPGSSLFGSCPTFAPPVPMRWWGELLLGMEGFSMDQKLKDRTEPTPGDGEQGDLDYFEVETRWSTWYVSTVMARHIQGILAASKPPRWLTFVDLVGARILIRTDAIVSIAQNTAEQRSRARIRHRLLRRERQLDGEWDE